MTIDEAIAKYKEIINTDVNCPAHCNISCDKCVQESEQLVEWLEELKAIKEKGRYVQGNKAGQKIGYRNAIDECIEIVKFHKDSWDGIEWSIRDIEKLKERVDNE